VPRGGAAAGVHHGPAKHAAQRFSETISDPARLVLAARRTGEIVGTLSAALEAATTMRPIRTATLTSIYVHPRYRRSGVGARLVEQFHAWAREMNATRVAVTAYTTNKAAISFYQRAGFMPYTLTLEADLARAQDKADRRDTTDSLVTTPTTGTCSPTTHKNK
jgi:GNAT superfamily N-acetyltransferase